MIWLILEPSLWRLLNRLPIDFGNFGHYSRRGWHFHDKATSHLKYGPVYALVTPCDVYVYCAGPDAIHEYLLDVETFFVQLRCIHCLRFTGHVYLEQVGPSGQGTGKY
ncbi:hypothetical protein BOTCAL_0380g00110 [Botryotinia calthae]|uniref:Uncharacterized protein n=1 Tax=Botryotinia calthae TaxID=38488 RepID=A0A4Y8CRF7_9HELO|nr:hypothetical protein BOTCAL_0380g00110 [Botryotinia calthae]